MSRICSVLRAFGRRGTVGGPHGSTVQPVAGTL
jgi:hypothetical protein